MQMQIILSYVDTQYNHSLHNKESTLIFNAGDFCQIIWAYINV